MTKLDEICEILSEVEFADDTARKLLTKMETYGQTYDRTLADLRKIPGFRKLWDAIEEAAHLSAHEEV